MGVNMKNIGIAVLAILTIVNIAYASEGYEYKGSHTGFDVSAESAVLQMIESQVDPKTEKVMMDGKALKFEYFDNHFSEMNGFLVGAAHFSDNDDQYIFDYYVKGERVVKILLFSKNGSVLNKQVYPEEGEGSSE